GAWAHGRNLDEQVGAKLALKAETPLHSLRGLEAEVPGVRVAARQLGAIVEVGTHGNRHAVADEKGRRAVLVGADDLREREGEVLGERRSPLTRLDVRDT